MKEGGLPKRRGLDKFKRILPLVLAGLSSDTSPTMGTHHLESQPVVESAPIVSSDSNIVKSPQIVESKSELTQIAAYEREQSKFTASCDALKAYLDDLRYNATELQQLQKRMQRDYVDLSRAIGNLEKSERVNAEKKLVSDFFDVYTYKVTGKDDVTVAASDLLDTPSGTMGGLMSSIYYDDPDILDYFEQVLTDTKAENTEDVLIFMHASHGITETLPDILENLKDLGRTNIDEEKFTETVQDAENLYNDRQVYQRLYPN